MTKNDIMEVDTVTTSLGSDNAESTQLIEDVLSDELISESSENSDSSEEETTDSSDDILTTSQIKELQESLSMMKVLINDVRDTFNTECTLSSVKPEIYEKLSNLSKEEFDKLNDVDLEKIYLEFKDSTVAGELSFDELKDKLAAIHESAIDLKDINKQATDLENEVNVEIKKYTEYVLSPEYAQKQAEKIAELEKRLKETDDENERKSITDVLAIIISSRTLDFLFTRFKKYDEKETKNIVDAFFDKDKSTYILKRYKDTASKLNLDQNIYARFVNLEERYLPEQYHAFNNLFVFITIRMIAYTDTKSKSETAYVGAILQQLTKLFYNKFTDEGKEKFITTVENVLNYFIDYVEKFKKGNESYKEHPYRIKMKELRAKKIAESEAAKNEETEDMVDDVSDIIEDKNGFSDKEKVLVDEELDSELAETDEECVNEVESDAGKESVIINGRKIIL